MAVVLQIVDIDDPVNNVLFDLNDPTGANSLLYGNVSTAILQDVDLGFPTGTPPRAPMKMRVRFDNTTYDGNAKAVGTLANFLAQGCTIKYVANGSTDVRYIEIDPSPTPVLLDGKPQALFNAMTLIDTPEGITLEVLRLPYLRGDKLDPTVNKLVTNPTMLRDSNQDGTPDGWTITSTPTLTISAAQESLHVVAGAATRGVFQATAAASASSGQVWTVSVDVKVTSGTAALILDWRTAADATISNVTTTQTATGWKRITASGTAPATTDHIRLRLESSGGASTFDVRNAQVELSATASPFRVVAETMRVDPATTSGMATLLPVYNPTTAPAPCELTAAFPDASTSAVEVDYALLPSYGIMGRNRVADLLNGPFYAQAEATGNGWTATLATGTTSTADANASGGNMARIAHTTDPNTLAKRLTLTRSTVLDCLRGRYTVYARLKANSARIYDLQLNWSLGASALRSNDVVQHDVSAAAAFDYVYISLGDIEIPDELNIAIGNLTLEIWTAIDSGAAANLDIDHLAFVPADDVAFATMPTGPEVVVPASQFTSPPQKLTADPVWTAGAYSSGGGYYLLNAANKAAGAGSNANGLFSGAALRHRTSFDIQYGSTTQPTDTVTFVWGIGDITDNDTLDSTGANTQSTVVSPAGALTRMLLTVDWSDESGDKYQPRVGVSSVTGFADVKVFSITDQIIPAAVQNEKIRSDPGSLPTRSDVEKLDSSGNVTIPLAATAVAFTVPPGLSLVYINPFDSPPIAYNENRSTLARTMTVTPVLYPRFYS